MIRQSIHPALMMLIASAATAQELAELKVATANVLSINKASMSPAGMAAFDFAAYAKHNEIKDGSSPWMEEVLTELMVTKGVNLLALQEIDLPLFNSIKKFTEQKNGGLEGRTNFQYKYFDINGKKNNPEFFSGEEGVDSLYVVWKPPSQFWKFDCSESKGIWEGAGSKGKTLQCQMTKGSWGKEMKLNGLFVHGDSNFKKMEKSPTMNFTNEQVPDFVMGDFNMEDKEHIYVMLKNAWGQQADNNFKILPTAKDQFTVTRGEYLFRKIAQQFENANGFEKCEPGDCTCERLEPTDGTKRPKNVQGALLKICNEFQKTKTQSSKDFMNKYSMEAMGEATYDFKNWKRDWMNGKIKLIPNGEKGLITPESTQYLVQGEIEGKKMLNIEYKVEDFIVVNLKTVVYKEDEPVEVYKYEEATENLEGEEQKMPCFTWPSDHFPVIKTLQFKSGESSTAIRTLHFKHAADKVKEHTAKYIKGKRGKHIVKQILNSMRKYLSRF